MWRKSVIDDLRAVASSSYRFPANHCNDSLIFVQGHQITVYTYFLHSYADLDKFDTVGVRDDLLCGGAFGGKQHSESDISLKQILIRLVHIYSDLFAIQNKL